MNLEQNLSRIFFNCIWHLKPSLIQQLSTKLTSFISFKSWQLDLGCKTVKYFFFWFLSIPCVFDWLRGLGVVSIGGTATLHFPEQLRDLCLEKLVQVVVCEWVDCVVYYVEGVHCNLEQKLFGYREGPQVTET